MKEEKSDKKLFGVIPEMDTRPGFSDKVMDRVIALQENKEKVTARTASFPNWLIILLGSAACIVLPILLSDNKIEGDSLFVNFIHKLEPFYQIFNSPLLSLGFLTLFCLLLFERLLAKSY